MLELQPLDIQRLKPFPLSRNLSVLPLQFLQEFLKLYDLVKGYAKSLTTYKEYDERLATTVNDLVEKLNGVIRLLEDYEKLGPTMAEQIKTIENLYEEFTSFEVFQYQLLSSNYNQNLLKLKFSKLTNQSDIASVSLVKDYRKNPEQDILYFLQDFKKSRKTYHVRKEKLNRWDEERISGFI